MHAQGNARYIVGHRPLWRAVITPWAPMCTFVRATNGIHLLAGTWDDGIPSDIPHEHLVGLTWNASKTVNAIAGIEGLGDARVIAVDGMSPGLAKLLGMLAPQARLIDGEALCATSVRRNCPRRSIACARRSRSPRVRSARWRSIVRPGARELDLKGAFEEAVCRYGLNHVAYEGTFCAAPPESHGLRRIPTERPLGAGELVVLHGAVHYAGYEGIAGRTRPCVGPTGTTHRNQRALAQRFLTAQRAAIDVCVPGASGGAVAAAWSRAGGPSTDEPLVYGIGLGVEWPLIGGIPDDATDAGDEVRLQAGMTLVVQGTVHEPGVGSYFAADIILVSDDGPVRLSRSSHAPFDAPE